MPVAGGQPKKHAKPVIMQQNTSNALSLFQIITSLLYVCEIKQATFSSPRRQPEKTPLSLFNLSLHKTFILFSILSLAERISLKIWGPFLEGPENFAGPESHS